MPKPTFYSLFTEALTERILALKNMVFIQAADIEAKKYFLQYLQKFLDELNKIPHTHEFIGISQTGEYYDSNKKLIDKFEALKNSCKIELMSYLANPSLSGLAVDTLQRFVGTLNATYLGSILEYTGKNCQLVTSSYRGKEIYLELQKNKHYRYGIIDALSEITLRLDSLLNISILDKTSKEMIANCKKIVEQAYNALRGLEDPEIFIAIGDNHNASLMFKLALAQNTLSSLASQEKLKWLFYHDDKPTQLCKSFYDLKKTIGVDLQYLVKNYYIYQNKTMNDSNISVELGLKTISEESLMKFRAVTAHQKSSFSRLFQLPKTLPQKNNQEHERPRSDAVSVKEYFKRK